MNLTRALVVSTEVLLGHKLRTLLSTSGIAIGVAAVVLMVGAGQAAQEDVLRRVRALGTNLITVQAGRYKMMGGRQRRTATFDTLVPADARAIAQRLDAAQVVAPVLQRAGQISVGNRKVTTQVFGVPPEYFQIRGMGAASGSLYGESDERSMARVAVLGPTAAANLFPDLDPVGRSLLINRTLFRVAGVSTARGQDLGGHDQDDVIYIPLGTAMKRVYNLTYLNSILVQARDSESTGPLMEEMRTLLRKNHRLRPGKEDDFALQDQAQLMQSEQDTSQAFRVLVGSVASVSLFTGGVGILAVMLISIRERTREIGLRRALGGRRRDVRTQFLLESATISLLGGFAGTALGLGGNYITCRSMGWPVVWPWEATAVGLGSSVLLGILFGLYPALKAARLEPATALHAAA